MLHDKETVGIAAIGCYIPQTTVSSLDIAEQAGISVNVLIEKIGMHKKPVAAPNEQPSQMAMAAAQSALERAQLDPLAIDFIIFCGSAPQDYLLWSPAGKLQDMLGLKNAFAFEVTNGCNGANLSIHIAREMLLGNPAFHNALVVTADKYSPFIDYTRQDDLSVFHISDAACAVVVRKNEPTNTILSYFQISDGSYADFVKIKHGGTMHPYSTPGNYEKQTFSVENPQELASLLTEVYFNNYITAIRTALDQSGHSTADVDYLFTNQVKASTMASILETLQLPPSKTLRSIKDYGHMGTVDTLFALSSFMEAGRIVPGNLVVLASSAIGFSWAALVLQF